MNTTTRRPPGSVPRDPPAGVPERDERRPQEPHERGLVAEPKPEREGQLGSSSRTAAS